MNRTLRSRILATLLATVLANLFISALGVIRLVARHAGEESKTGRVRIGKTPREELCPDEMVRSYTLSIVAVAYSKKIDEPRGSE